MARNVSLYNFCGIPIEANDAPTIASALALTMVKSGRRGSMWPFSRWRRAREKALISELLSRHMPQELLDDMLTKPRDLSLEKRTVFFALLQLRDDEAEALAERLRQAVDIATEAQGMVDIMPPFVMVAFGIPLTDEPETLRSLRQRMIEKLLSCCGRDIRIVHGEADGLVGSLGSERRFTYGAAIPRLSTAFHRLMILEFGVVSEVTL